MVSRLARGVTAAVIVLAAALAMAACAPSGVSQADIDAAKQQVQAQQQKNAQLQQQLSDAQAQIAAKDKAVTDAQATAAAAAKAGGSAPTAAPAAGGAQVLLGVFKPTPAPPPPPAPTAVPGVTPAPRPGPPASIYENAGPYFIYVEVLATSTVSKFGYASTVPCTPSSVFKRGQKMVFRFEVLDTATGKRLTDKDANYALSVKFPNGDEPVARFSQRGGGRVPGAPWMWSVGWDIPTDYPLGGVDYLINIKAPDGKLISWKAPAIIDAGSDSRPKVVE